MKLLHLIKNNIPNSITCLNLLSGGMAVIFSFNCDGNFGAFKGYELAFMFIGLAAIFDFCDGLAARLLHAYSALGKELDSLADLISFGLAPSLLIYNTMQSFNEPGSILPYFALLIAVFAAIRLAKFNIDDRQTTSFIGLPVPANALFWIGLCAWMHKYAYIGNIAVLALIVIFSYLMVSRLRMFSLKFKNLSFGENIIRYFLLLGAVLFIVSYQVSGLTWTIMLYIVLSIFSRRNPS
ncbi:MAG: CDP-diacylglycerol--serine O-phosphatidyltransferase [Muribaculaceae bacterium]|nr:CDP-diacylglycerol--serine O-phosphatidyltransferase [Muribaculaceae bacterium]